MSLAGTPPAVAAGPPPRPPQVTPQAIVQFLNYTIDWYRRVISIDPTPLNSQDVLYRERVRQDAIQAVRLGFDWARAEAALLDAEAKTSASTTTSGGGGGGAAAAADRNRTRAQLLAGLSQRIAQLQAQIDDLNQQIKDKPEAAADLTARRDELTAELNLANVRRDALQKMAQFSGALGGTSETLSQQITDLENTLPEVKGDQQANGAAQVKTAAASAEAATAQQTFRPESEGIFGLVGQLFTLTGRMSDLRQLTEQTDALLQRGNEPRRAPLRDELQDAIAQASALAASRPTNDARALDAQRQRLDELTDRLRLLTAASVPLANQNALLVAIRDNDLAQWRTATNRQYFRVLRSLLIRLGAIVLAILVLLGISKLWKRATFRYVTDVRRRRQFLVLRRIVVGVVVIIILIAGLATEISSLATFAGLITAGIAVALQTVILSGFAYFFFIGRFGVRVGDRVTISGITGDVVEIGLFRLYLMELAGAGRDLYPTGRIVVFSNSVLFQPNAFFKQLPGADFAWHEVGLTLSPDSDHRLAEMRLLEAVNKVFAEYRDNIERQYSSVKDFLHLPIAPPKPEGRLRFVDAGLEFVVRYPVEIHRAAEIDDRITRELLATIEREPNLKLVATSTPKIQPADGRP